MTVLSPCILPVLPIVLSSSVGDEQSRSKPYGVVIGFVLSFTFFTLFLSLLVKSVGLPSNLIRNLAIVLIGLFGFSLVIPGLQSWFEQLFSRMTQKMPATSQKKGFTAGLLIGVSIGILWTPCVGPILASVISLAIIGEVTLSAVFVTLGYSLGTAIPMFLIIKGGSNVLQKVPWLTRNTAKIQTVFGVLMILTAFGIAFDLDRKFQTWVLTTFPDYGTGLTKIEENKLVQNQLSNVADGISPEAELGKPMDKEEMSKSGQESPSGGMDLPRIAKAPELIQGGEWFNSQPLSLEELRDKVVLVDFWTYSCINCQRTFPYLRTWWDKYEDDGLVIIGVHAPEFEFEKSAANVAKALEDFGLEYPVMQDNDFQTWRAYKNRYWPAKYIVDHEGYIRYTHFGEGKYDETERVIQTLLNEAGLSEVVHEVSNPDYQNYAETPETYLGYGRIDNFASPEAIIKDRSVTYSRPQELPEDHFAWDGECVVTEEYANPAVGTSLYFNFEAKKVFLVMNPADGSSQVRVYVDGTETNVVTVDADDLYQLVELDQPGQHELRLEFLDGNTEVYAFTFG